MPRQGSYGVGWRWPLVVAGVAWLVLAGRRQLDGLLASGRLAKAVYLEPQLFERAEYLRAALDEMRRIYGSFENYVHQALGISDEQLEQIRENLLEG